MKNNIKNVHELNTYFNNTAKSVDTSLLPTCLPNIDNEYLENKLIKKEYFSNWSYKEMDYRTTF